MNRIATEDLAEGVAQGREWLEQNPQGALRAVLIVDGYITLERGKTDALVLEMRDYQEEQKSFSMAIPYRSPDAPGGFAVFRPKFLAFPGATKDSDYDDAVGAFFEGVDQHSEGAKVWNQYIDQSQ